MCSAESLSIIFLCIEGLLCAKHLEYMISHSEHHCFTRMQTLGQLEKDAPPLSLTPGPSFSHFQTFSRVPSGCSENAPKWRKRRNVPGRYYSPFSGRSRGAQKSYDRIQSKQSLFLPPQEAKGFFFFLYFGQHLSTYLGKGT